MTTNHKPKVAVVVSHPIQHFCPQYASYAGCSDWEVKVFFASALGSVEYVDKQFDTTIKWNNLYLDLFNHQFLNGKEVIPVNLHLDAPEIELALEQYETDIIITYGYIQKFQRRAVKWAVKNQKKIVYISDSEHAQETNYIKEYMKKPFLRAYFNQIDIFFTVGNYNEHYYAWFDVPMKKMIRTGFPIDLNYMEMAYQERFLKNKSVRNLLKISDKEVVISVVGKVLDFKRQQDVIDALYELERISKTPYTALIIGSGPNLEKVKERAAKLTFNKAIFTGFVTPEYLPNYLASTDVYIHPSSKDRHSLSVSEALYMGCPIIISDRCGSYGPTDDVQTGKNGFIYKCKDIQDLTRCILLLGENKNLRYQFSGSSHDIAVRTQSLAHGEGLRAALTHCGLLRNNFPV